MTSRFSAGETSFLLETAICTQVSADAVPSRFCSRVRGRRVHLRKPPKHPKISRKGSREDILAQDLPLLMSIDRIKLSVTAATRPIPPAITIAPPLFGVPIVQGSIESIANGRLVRASPGRTVPNCVTCCHIDRTDAATGRLLAKQSGKRMAPDCGDINRVGRACLGSPAPPAPRSHRGPDRADHSFSCSPRLRERALQPSLPARAKHSQITTGQCA